jgi:hypothetical protein
VIPSDEQLLKFRIVYHRFLHALWDAIKRILFADLIFISGAQSRKVGRHLSRTIFIF